jgi:hypothetical protein
MLLTGVCGLSHHSEKMQLEIIRKKGWYEERLVFGGLSQACAWHLPGKRRRQFPATVYVHVDHRQANCPIF